ncbi:MAG TPA: hypothetical protein PL185_04150, partial [Flavobacteriales bacterium]|nr:hypothetical protein [Flavobacteriales bacterium]
MAKNIEFSAEEMSELHAFYIQEMEKAEERLKAIKSIIAKIGTAPKKRGRKPSAEKQLTKSISADLKAAAPKVAGRKRGRPAKPKTDAPKAAPKRRGRPAKVTASPVVASSTAPVVATEPKKRG